MQMWWKVGDCASERASERARERERERERDRERERERERFDSLVWVKYVYLFISTLISTLKTNIN